MKDVRAPHPRSLSPRGLAILGWLSLLVAGAIFFTIAFNVATHAPLVVFDANIAGWLDANGGPEMTAFLFAITQVHSTIGVALMAAAFAIVLARLREWYWLLTLALSLGGGMLLNSLLKHAYARTRPHYDDPWVTLTSFSFPSGHTAGAVLFYGVAAAFLVTRFHDRRRRVVCIAGAVVTISLVALSRMYVGAHYLSDVVAAAASSTAWLVLCLSTVHGYVRRHQPSTRL